MSLYNYIDADYKKQSALVKVNGITMRDVIDVSINKSLDGLAEATVSMLSKNSIVPESKVTIDLGYNGELQRVFTGFVDDIEAVEFEEVYTINCRDVLKKAMDTFLIQEIKYGIDVEASGYYYSTYSTISGGTFQVHEYNSLSALNASHPETTSNYSTEGVLAEAVVQWMLVLTGLQEGTEIQVDSTDFWIGDINPATFHLESVYDSIMKIGDLIGWYVYADPGGVVRFKKRPRNQSDTSKIWTYRTRSDPKNLYHISCNTTNTDLRNYVEVRGYNGIQTVRRAESPYIGNTPYRGVLISNELIDTSGIAEYMAARVLADLNRLKTTVQGECDGNPYLFPGLTVSIDSKIVAGDALLLGVESTINAENGYITKWDAEIYNTGDIEPGGDPLIVPVISYDYTVSVGDPTYIIGLNGAGSYSDSGPITAYEWTLPSGVYKHYYDTPVTVQGPQVEIHVKDYLITSGNYLDVGLQVWDSAGNTATITGAIDYYTLSGNGIMYRHLYAALTDRAAVSLDTGNTWKENNSIQPMSVAASNFEENQSYTTSGYAIFGTDGAIYRTGDYLETLEVVQEVDGKVLDCYVAELDSRYALAATDTGDVWSSRDKGFTWTKIGEFGFVIYQTRLDWQHFENVSVHGQGGSYYSMNLGANWSHMTDWDNGSAVYWNDAGTMSNYYAHSSGINAYENNQTFYQVPTTASGCPAPTELITVSVEIDDDYGLMGVDSTGQHFVVSGDFNYGDPLICTSCNEYNKTRHMIRDGEIASLAYYATQSGVYKSLDRNYTIEPLLLPSGSWPSAFSHTSDLNLGGTGFGEQVAFGPLTSGTVIPVEGNVEVWLSPWGTGGNFWRYIPDDGWSSIAPPLTGNRHWGQIVVHPTDPNKMLVGTWLWSDYYNNYTPYPYLYMTADGGSTWENLLTEVAGSEGYFQQGNHYYNWHGDNVVIWGNSSDVSGQFKPTLWYDDPFNGTGAQYNGKPTMKMRWKGTEWSKGPGPFHTQSSLNGSVLKCAWSRNRDLSHENATFMYVFSLPGGTLSNSWTTGTGTISNGGSDGVISPFQAFNQGGTQYMAGVRAGDDIRFFYDVENSENQSYGNKNGTSCCRLSNGTVLVCRRWGFGTGGWGQTGYYYPGVLNGSVPDWQSTDVSAPQEWSPPDKSAGSSWNGTTLGAISTDRQTGTTYAVQFTAGPNNNKILMNDGIGQVVVDFPPGITTSMVYPGIEVVVRQV